MACCDEPFSLSRMAAPIVIHYELKKPSRLKVGWASKQDRLLILVGMVFAKELEGLDAVTVLIRIVGANLAKPIVARQG